MIEKINKWLPLVTFVALVALVLVGGNQSAMLGGATNYDSIDVTDGYLVDGTTVIDGSGNVVGSITIDESDTFTLDGVDVMAIQQSFTAATTTPCSIANPFSATSTIVGYMAVITTGTSTAATIDVATSTTAYATSTNLVTAYPVGSGKQAFIQWFPSGASNATLGPSEYINIKTAGAGLGGYTYTGTCSALLMKP